jgi:hypothetical protein
LRGTLGITGAWRQICALKTLKLYPAHRVPPKTMQRYNCDICTAQCTFEAMQMCQMPSEKCPVLLGMTLGIVVDRRPTDADPEFPSEFSYAEPRI